MSGNRRETDDADRAPEERDERVRALLAEIR